MATTDYALLDENNIVINKIVIFPYLPNEWPNTVPIDQRPIDFGDQYEPSTGKFYRNGKELLSYDTEARIETGIEATETDLNLTHSLQKNTDYDLKELSPVTT